MKFISKYTEALVTLLICVGIFIFVGNKINTTKREGIITVAKVTKYESAESGSDFYLDIFLNGKTYSTTVDQHCQANCVGNYFFVKVRRDDPTDYPVFYGDKQVPDCILQNVKVFEGWSFFPSCDNY